MLSLRHISIKRKLTLIIMAGSTVALLLVSAGFVAYEVFTFRQTMTRDLSTLAEILGNQSTAVLAYDDCKAAEEILRALSAKEHIEGACLYRDDQPFASYPAGKAGFDLFPSRPEPEMARFENDRLVLFHQIKLGAETLGTICLRSDLKEMDQRLGRYAGIIVLFTLASWGITWPLSVLLRGLVSKPIFDLAQCARTVSVEKNFSLRAHKHAQDEMGQLVDGFNEMLAQIQARDAALQQANDDLEKRVRERTRDLERAYDELRQTQQTVMQQERLKALGQMASGIAHDINNALSPVVGFADLLAGRESLSETGRKYLQHIRTAGEDIAHIVSRLREFYRHRDGRESLLPLQLNRVAEQVIEMTRPRWRDMPQERGVTVEVRADLDPAMPEFLGMESEVREALTNLILNAVDALPQGGCIVVRTRVGCGDSESATAPAASHATLEVTDTGIGMDEKTRKHCLEPFFSTKGKRGTGLGLAMAYGVMERHEGKIEIESQLAKGTTVRLIFPIRKPKGAGALDRNAASLQPLQILCIDDEPLLRELLQDLLERDGHRVHVTDGGQSGLDAFRDASRRGQPFDIVITDLGMPYLDGRQVVKTLKLESPSTPIVMLTGWGAFMKEGGGMPAQVDGVDGVLSKPPRSGDLRETLRRLAPRRNGKPQAQPA